MSNQKPHINDYKDGMNKDFQVESFPASSYEDAHNIRLFTSGEGAVYGAVQNITGNKLILNLPEYNGQQLYIIGSCQLRDSVILFATPESSQEGGIGFIYEVSFNFQDNSSTFNLIYSNAFLYFSRLYPIEAIAIRENPSYERVYFSDYENPTRSINIRDAAINNSPPDVLEFFPNPGNLRAEINEILAGGSLKAGVYSYTYFFTTFDGHTTITAPISQQIHIVQDSETLWADNEYGGTPEVGGDPIGTTKKVIVNIPLTNVPQNVFTECTLVAIYMGDFEEEPTVLKVSTKEISTNPTNVVFEHTGNEEETQYQPFNEFITETSPFKTNKTFGIKDNILFCSNIKGNSILVPEDISQGLLTKRYTNFGMSYVEDPNYNFNIYDNPFNDESGNAFGLNNGGTYTEWKNNFQFKYQSNGTTLGGEGDFIKYKFVLEDLRGDDSNEIENGFYVKYYYANREAYDPVNLDDGVSYINRSYTSFASPYNRVLRGYKRGEVYRFGIVFYDKKGTPSTVQFIGDIKFPEISDTTDNITGYVNDDPNIPLYHFPVAVAATDYGVPYTINSVTDLYSVGIEFDINLPQSFLDKISHYQIVRVKREENDKTRLAQGVVTKWYLPSLPGEAVWNPIAEVTDIPGHLNTYHKNNSENPQQPGERAASFEYNNLIPPITEGVKGDYGATAAIGTSSSPYGYPANETRNLISTSVSYQSAASITSLLSFYCPEATYNHFVPTFNNGIDYLKTVGFLAYTSKFSHNPWIYPYGSPDTNAINFPNYTTRWGHTFYTPPVVHPFNPLGIIGTIETTAGSGLENYRPYLAGDNGTQGDGSYERYPEFEDYRYSIRTFTTKARHTNPIPGNLYLEEENFELIEDMRYIGPGRYRDTDVFSVGEYQCRNIAWELGNVHAERARKSRMARGGTCLVMSLGGLSDQEWRTANEQQNYGNPPTFRKNKGSFIGKHSSFTSNAIGGSYGENYAGGAFLVDYVRRLSGQYGGNGKAALAANTFIATSAPIPVSDTRFRVFEGDTFVSFYTFYKNFWNNQWTNNTSDGSGATRASDVAFNGNNSSTLELIVMPVESTINCALNSGSNYMTGGAYSLGGNTPEIYRNQEYIDNEGVSNVLNNRNTAKAFDYDPVYSNEQITKFYFSDPLGFRPVNNFDVRTYYSNTKILGEKIDNFTKFGLFNYRDIDPAYGPINKLLNLKDELVAIQDDAIGVFLINTREMINSESGSLITLGTGSGLQDYTYLTTQNGSIHQYGNIVSDLTAYIFDAKRKSVIIMKGAQPGDLSKAKGLNDFFNKEVKGFMTLTKEQGGDNPLIGIGATLGYDKVNREVLISFFGNKIGYNLNSTYGVNNAFVAASGNGQIGFSSEVELVSIDGELFELLSHDIPYEFLYQKLPQYIDNLTELEDDYRELLEFLKNSRTLKPVDSEGITTVYSEPLQVFTSFYDFTPSHYISSPKALLSVSQKDNLKDRLYIHNYGEYGKFYEDNAKDTSITIIANTAPIFNKILRFLEYNCIVKDSNGVIQQSAGLTNIRVENDYQDSGIVPIDQIHRFRKFRIKVPRDQQQGRFRSTYFKISLFFDNSVNLSLTLQRIMAYFDIHIY